MTLRLPINTSAWRERERERMEMMVQSLVFEQPASVVMRALPVITLVSLASLGFSESIGKHLQYSKFWNVGNSNSTKIKLSSKTGMLLVYTPAFLAGAASFALFPAGDLRFLLLKLALTIHFFKRILEVLFVHKYSGGMDLDTTIFLSAIYFVLITTILYIQNLSQSLAEPSVDLKYKGIVLYIVGIFGNFYHHCLLSKLREKGGEKGYTIPKGGLFNLVTCPHYLLEIVEFFGFFFIAQTLFSFSCALGSAFYLAGRSYVTRKWYISKFENFPPHVRALLPHLF